MKNKITARVAFFLTAAMLLASCGKSYIEENQDNYSATDVIPVVLGVSGPSSVYHTEYWNYSPNYSRSGSTWDWTVTGATLTLSTDTRTATLDFPAVPAGGLATITVSETTSAGVKSPDVVVEINVLPFTVLGISGPSVMVQTFTGTFKVTYNRPGSGSTWNWNTSDATLQSLSEDTKTATFLFNEVPTNDTVVIKVTETSASGVTSPVKELKVKVIKFCPLPNGIVDLEGSWPGEDAWYDSEVTMANSDEDETTIEVSGLNAGFITDWWGEEIIEGGTITMTINNDGTLVIPRQYIFTTEYDGDPYRYEIDGEGMWDNCGANPTLSIEYNVYYEGKDEGYAAAYSPDYLPTPYFTAEITLDDSKSKKVFENVLKASPRK